MENNKFYLKCRKSNDYDIDVSNWLRILDYEVERGGRYKITVRSRNEEKTIELKANAAFNIEFATGWPPNNKISWPAFRLIMEGNKNDRQ